MNPKKIDHAKKREKDRAEKRRPSYTGKKNEKNKNRRGRTSHVRT